MSQPAPQDAILSETAHEASAAPNRRARQVLLKRLTDVVCLPSSRVDPFERAMTADLLLDVLREADPDQRGMVARRLANLAEPPAGLLRMLLGERIEVATPLLVDGLAVSDAALIDCARHTGLEHRRLMGVRAPAAAGEPGIERSGKDRVHAAAEMACARGQSNGRCRPSGWT